MEYNVVSVGNRYKEIKQKLKGDGISNPLMDCAVTDVLVDEIIQDLGDTINSSKLKKALSNMYFLGQASQFSNN